MTQKTLPLLEIHKKLGAKMAMFAGFEMPMWYTSITEEHKAVRQGAGVFDVSHMGEFILRGAGALDLIQRVSTNDAAKLRDGQAQYTCMTNEAGGIVDDMIVYRISEEEYMLVVNAGSIEKDWDWISGHNSHGATIQNVSAHTCLFAVQGPKAVGIVQRITQVDLSSIKYYHFAIGDIADARHAVISNTGYTGAGGFELYVNSDQAASVWDALFQAGRHEGIAPIGLAARDTLRLEKGYCLYGNDIDDATSPLEAGLGWVTKFTKAFTASDLLKQQREKGITRKLVGFKMLDKGIPRHDYAIKDPAGKTIGKVTSGAISPILGVGIGLGYVENAHAEPGSPIAIAVRSKDLKAVVHTLPFV